MLKLQRPRRTFKKKILLRFLVSYVLILLIPLLLGYIAYRRISQNVYTNTINTNLSLMQQIQEVVDSRLMEIENVANQLKLNPAIRQFSHYHISLDNYFYYDLLFLLQQLFPYQLTNDFLVTFFIYIEKLDYIISHDTAYKMSSFYNSFFTYADMDYNEWYTGILSQSSGRKYLPAVSIEFSGEKYRTIPYLVPMSSSSYSNSTSKNLLLFIDEKKVINLLSKIDLSNGGWAYIADSKGNIITYTSGGSTPLPSLEMDFPDQRGFLHTSIDGSAMSVIYNTSSENAWKYVAIVPENIIMKDVKHLQLIALIVMTVSILAGMALSYSLAFYNAKPLRDIIDTLKGSLGMKGSLYDYANLKRSARYVIENNAILVSKLKEQQPLIRSTFFYKLLMGEYKDSRENQTILTHLEIDLIGSYFTVVMLHIASQDTHLYAETLTELEMLRVVIKNAADSIIHGKDYLHYLDEDKIVLLLCLNLANKQECIEETERIVSCISDKLYKEYAIHVSFSAGRLYMDHSDIHRSYNEARLVMEYNAYYGREDSAERAELLWYDDLPIEKQIYYYPIEAETRLMGLIKAGHTEQAKRLLEEIYNENSSERNLSPSMQNGLINEMKSTAVKISSSFDIDNDPGSGIYDLDIHSDFENAYKQISQVFINLCDRISEKRTRKSQDLINIIIAYIDSHYSDKMICLSSVSSRFGLTETYFSHFFKNQSGENFSAYLEKIRMEHACKLLENKKLPIREIAVQVGYTSDKSFRRAFIRMKGVPPSSFTYTGK